jgi:hypothetical protein
MRATVALRFGALYLQLRLWGIAMVDSRKAFFANLAREGGTRYQGIDYQ